MFARRLRAYPVYLILVGASSFFFALITTVNLVYQVEVARLNPLQLVLVGTMLESVILLCEVPTGVLADVYSRRLSVIIGVFLIGAGFLVEGTFPVFGAILLAQVLWGVGYTFTSGAEQAWIADEVGEAAAGRAFLRGAQAGQLGGLLAAPVSVGLASVRLNLPILVAGALYLALGLFLVLFMPERGFRRAAREQRSSWQAMGGTFLQGARLVRGRPLLLTILGIAAFYGMSSEGFDRLWTAHMLKDVGLPALGGLDPVVWFGVITVGSMLLSMAATEVVRRRLDLTSHRLVARTLLAISALRIAATLVFALAGSFALALAALWSGAVLRRTTYPIYTAWLNRQIDAPVRATVFSMSSQMDAFGQIAGGPVVGAIGNTVSLRAALAVAGIALSPALLLYARASRQGRHSPAQVDETSVAEKV